MQPKTEALSEKWGTLLLPLQLPVTSNSGTLWRLTLLKRCINGRPKDTEKTCWQTSPQSKNKIVLEEFEACGAMRVTTETTNLKPSPTPDYINSNPPH